MDDAALENRPDLTREKLERTRMLMDKHAEDALVTGYEDLIAGLHLPDPDDRHVLGAEIRGRADVIVTRNTKHFPDDILSRSALRRNTRMSSLSICSTSRRGSSSRRRRGIGRV